MADEKVCSPEEMKSVKKFAAEVLASTGIKRKLILEETRCRLLRDARTLVNNLKVVSGGVIALIAERPLDAIINRAEWRKDTRKNKWKLGIINEVRKRLNKKFEERSSVELKSTKPEYARLHMDRVGEAVYTSIMAKARNISNLIAVGVGASIVAASTLSFGEAWMPAVVACTTALSVAMQQRVNSKMIRANVATKTRQDDRTKDVIREHTQLLGNSQYFENIENFSSRMSEAMDIACKKEIIANDRKQSISKTGADANTDIMAMWGTLSAVLPLAITGLEAGATGGLEAGLTAAFTTGAAAAVCCASCFTMGTTALNNFFTSRLEEVEGYKLVASHLKSLQKKDRTYKKGDKNIEKGDNVILISKDMAYQHKNFDGNIASLVGENLFENIDDIVIKPGVTILGGASGAGKSTLTSLLRRGSFATQGSIQLGSIDENGKFVGTEYKDIANIVQNVGVAFQSAPEAECMTVEEYIMLENPDAEADKVREVKELLGIGDGEGSGMIDENAKVSNQLSGGQQKRIELARVLIKDSPIMILDEPTSGVDVGMSKNIVSHLKELGKEKTIIYITHDAEEIKEIGAYQAIDIDKVHSGGVKNAIRTYDLSDGKVCEEYVEFFKNRKRETDKEEEERKQEELDRETDKEEEERKQEELDREAQRQERLTSELIEAYDRVSNIGLENSREGLADEEITASENAQKGSVVNKGRAAGENNKTLGANHVASDNMRA